jgi:hypothetical protein
MVIVMACAANGVRYRSETTYSDGYASRAEYSANYDGKEAICDGFWRPAPAGLPQASGCKHGGSHIYKRGGQVVATSRRVVSKDGRKMTITTNSPDQLGKNVRSIGVYEKAKEVADMEQKIAK